jgi:diamine N-acetyltransferase
LARFLFILNTMLSIRKANEADIELIRELCFKVWPQTYSHIISAGQIEYMLHLMYSPNALQKQMTEGAIFIILYDEEMPVGFASYQQLASQLFKLHKLYVLPQMQGKGAGAFIIQFIENEIASTVEVVLQLQVNKYNRAKNFYEKLGFAVAEEIVFDIGNGYVMDDYIMQKNIRNSSG